MWSTKHHAPTVRRARRGNALRTVVVPTTASRLGVTSSVRASACGDSGVGGAAVLLTGPLIRSVCVSEVAGERPVVLLAVAGLGRAAGVRQRTHRDRQLALGFC